MKKDKNSKSVHPILLEMLAWFHEQCVANNFRYYVIGGTMLGAVRHKGFIPWDDDIDVAMPRKDYTKFIEKYSSEFHSPYMVEYPHETNKDYLYTSSKIYDTRTTLVERKRKNVKRGIYIDLFPLDGIGDTQEMAIHNYRKIYKLMRLHNMVSCAFRDNRRWYKNLSIVLGRLISPLFFSERKLNYCINHLCAQRDFDNTKYVGNLIGNWGYKEIMPRSYFGSPVIYEFEGIKVYGVEKPHEYLLSLYNDYMKLPPVEKQVSHHDYAEIRFDKSYLNK